MSMSMQAWEGGGKWASHVNVTTLTWFSSFVFLFSFFGFFLLYGGASKSIWTFTNMLCSLCIGVRDEEFMDLPNHNFLSNNLDVVDGGVGVHGEGGLLWAWGDGN